MNRFIIIFILGGFGYCILEILWRGYTHWTMFILGGLCLYALTATFNRLQRFHLALKAIIGGGIITVAELLTGCIVNLYLGWRVWDYSAAPYNLLGQICLTYSILWMLLCIPVALISDLLVKYIR